MSNKLDDRTKLLALAHLKSNKKPKEVSELLNISYAQALRLSKELIESEKRGTILDLFNLNEAALGSLLQAVKDDVSLPLAILDGEEVLEGELQELSTTVKGAQALDTEMQSTALELAKKIKILAISTSSPDTIVLLSESLSKLQTAFFAKGTNVQVNNFPGGKFEEFLSD